jgi:hypothetical protein
MRLKMTHALHLLRRDLARLNDLLYEGEPGAEYLSLAQVAKASNDFDEWLFDDDLLPDIPDRNPPSEELNADLQAVWARADATLGRPQGK